MLLESPFIDPTARIGDRTVIWRFAVILADVVIGDDCSIGSGSEIGRGSVIGNGSRIGAHVFLPSGSIIEEDVFVGPGVIATDDRYPRVRTPYKAEPPVIEREASIGAGALLLPGVRIGRGAMVGAGSVVTRDVPPGVTVYGNAATVRGIAGAFQAARS